MQCPPGKRPAAILTNRIIVTVLSSDRQLWRHRSPSGWESHCSHFLALWSISTSSSQPLRPSYPNVFYVLRQNSACLGHTPNVLASALLNDVSRPSLSYPKVVPLMLSSVVRVPPYLLSMACKQAHV